MNERIIELADKAVEDISSGPWNISDEFCIKFSRLVVQDNIQTLRGNGYDDAAQVLQDIHFGIEDPV
jgi:biotin operon repressor